MASSAPGGDGSGGVSNLRAHRSPLGLFKAAAERKQSFVQFFVMTGILLLSAKSLTQKYRIHELTGDVYSLEEERKGLHSRMDQIKESLLAEAALEPTGAFAARLRLLFGNGSN